MIEDVRCPACGARNGVSAEWCTQCFTPLGEDPTTGAAAGTGAADTPVQADVPPPPAPGSEVSGGPVPPAPAAGTGGLRSGGGRFRQADDGLEWACATCGEWNSIELLTCTVCSAPFGSATGDEQQPARTDVPIALLVGGSVVLPGLGHWLLGLRGTALLRAVLALVWGIGGLALFVQARASGQSLAPAIPLLLGWAIIAGGSANDAFVEAGGNGQRVLVGRTLLWLTIAVIGGTFAAVLVGVLSAANA